jgi:hypothetical protein
MSFPINGFQDRRIKPLCHSSVFYLSSGVLAIIKTVPLWLDIGFSYACTTLCLTMLARSRKQPTGVTDSGWTRQELK